MQSLTAVRQPQPSAAARQSSHEMPGSLGGLAVLLVLDAPAAAEAEQRGLRHRVYGAGGRCSINGDPPLPANELSHIVCEGWGSLRRLAPSLARRHSGCDGPPPKRPRVATASAGSHADERCYLVTRAWLAATLLAGEPQPESVFLLPAEGTEQEEAAVAASPTLPGEGTLSQQMAATGPAAAAAAGSLELAWEESPAAAAAAGSPQEEDDCRQHTEDGYHRSTAAATAGGGGSPADSHRSQSSQEEEDDYYRQHTADSSEQQ